MEKNKNEQGMNTNMHVNTSGTKNGILHRKHFFSGHFEFALVEFTSFLSFIRVSLSSSSELKSSVANKINSSNPLSQGLSLTVMFSQISLKS